MANIKSERELDMIRGKMLINAASKQEVHEFLKYVSVIESLVDEADEDDYFGTEGWRHKVGLT